MEKVISISKDMPEYGTVQKCLAAIRTADYSAVTRQDFDAALEAVAKSAAQEHDLDFSSAYEATITGETGKALYGGRESCPPTGTGPVVKRNDEISKAEAIERDAEHFSTAYGVPLEDARRQVADFYANQK